MTTGKKQIKINGFSLCPLFFLCVLCGSFPFMLKTYHRGNGEKKRKRRKTMKIGKK
jgi:hypothetical protein